MVGGPFPQGMRVDPEDAASVIRGLDAVDPMRNRERLTRILLEQDAGQGQSIHGWRCNYPDRYGPCDCVEQLVTALLEDD
jgi:hypothetical protein